MDQSTLFAYRHIRQCVNSQKDGTKSGLQLWNPNVEIVVLTILDPSQYFNTFIALARRGCLCLARPKRDPTSLNLYVKLACINGESQPLLPHYVYCIINTLRARVNIPASRSLFS